MSTSLAMIRCVFMSMTMDLHDLLLSSMCTVSVLFVHPETSTFVIIHILYGIVLLSSSPSAVVVDIIIIIIIIVIYNIILIVILLLE